MRNAGSSPGIHSTDWFVGPEGQAPWPRTAALVLTPLWALWTLPQTLVGLAYGVAMKLRGARVGLYRFGPFVFVVVKGRPMASSGISLGLVVLADRPSILTHEFCHLYTGLWLTWLYLPVYGLEYLILGHDRSFHERITVRLEQRTQNAWRPW
jgi:hypothetical protein